MFLFRRAYHPSAIFARNIPQARQYPVAITLYAYFALSEYLITWYGGVATDWRLLELLAGTGPSARRSGSWRCSLFVPVGSCSSRPPVDGLIVTASVLINIGMWVKRYLIIVPTLQTTFIPAEAAGINPHYFPSLVECMITAGGRGVSFFTLFAVFPSSVWETVEDAEDAARVAVRAPGPTPAGKECARCRR